MIDNTKNIDGMHKYRVTSNVYHQENDQIVKVILIIIIEQRQIKEQYNTLL